MHARSLLVVAAGLGAILAGGSMLRAAEKQASSADAVNAQRVTVQHDGKVIMRYRYGEDVIKPYVEELRTPGGVNILRDSPSDHKHHHALMFAVAVDGVNFWEERESFGLEKSVDPPWRLQTEVKTRNGNKATWDSCRQHIDWLSPEGPDGRKLLLREERTINVAVLRNAKATLLNWQSRLTAPGRRPAKITGADYFGLGMRFVESMDKGGTFMNADGKTGVKDTNAHRSAWCAYSAKADGKPVTVAMFDSPKNFRHPATWFTMDSRFAYLCATLDLSKEPIELPPEKPLLLRYGVALWDGTPEPAEIEKVYRQWIEKVYRQWVDWPLDNTQKPEK